MGRVRTGQTRQFLFRLKDGDPNQYRISVGADEGGELAQVLVEEMMIAANETAANLVTRNVLP